MLEAKSSRSAAKIQTQHSACVRCLFLGCNVVVISSLVVVFSCLCSFQLMHFSFFMASLAQEVVVNICQMFEECSSALQQEVNFITLSSVLGPLTGFGS